MQKSRNHVTAIFSALLATMPLMVNGAISIVQNFGPEDDLPISNSDLVDSGSPDLLFFTSTFPVGAAETHDGTIAYSPLGEDEGHFPGISGYYMNTIDNPLGYKIDSISVVTWNAQGSVPIGITGSTAHHHYKIEYRLIGSAEFHVLTTINVASEAGFYGYTRVNIFSLGLEEEAVDLVKFTWLDPLPTGNSAVAISEVDIFGSAITQVPEPGMSLLLLGAFPLFLRRSRQQAKGLPRSHTWRTSRHS